MIPSAMSLPRSATDPIQRPDSRAKGKAIDTEGTSGIRPRNRRLLTPGSEQELVSTSATSTPGGSRATSPLPARYPSRRTGRSPGNGGRGTGSSDGNGLGLLERSREGSGRNSPVGRSNGNGNGSGGFGSSLAGWSVEGTWMSSWNTLQGLASSVLGNLDNDSAESITVPGKKKKELRSRAKLPDRWGPPPQTPKDGGIGEGSIAEREAMVRAKKMTRVLEGRDEPQENMDTNGKFKRRTSSDDPRPNSPHEDDYALVYIHPVQKQDTLQGVVLRYNCKPDVFRKANRFWPNDSIQIRKTVILPVDACAIKGRPCDPPNLDDPGRGVDLLAPTPGIEESPYSNGSTTWPGTSYPNGTSAERPDESENPWVHVRWVLLDSSPNSRPVEIARMPRKTLGYFPPRRRKSQNTLSTISTPRASLDFPASTMSPSISHLSGGMPDSTVSTNPRKKNHLASHSSQLSSTLNLGSYFPPAPMSATSSSRTRPRRESVGEAADRLGWMRGPGGVGTLTGKGVRKPGPANDGLNSWAKKHIPGLAIDSLPSTSILGAETAHFGFNSEELPSIAEGASAGEVAAGNGSVQSMGLEVAAAAIEGWMRRFTIKGPGTPKGGGKIENPDLIELLDGTGSDDGRGFELSPGRVRSSTPIGTGREDLDGVIRGRASAGAKGGKGD